MTGPMGRRVRKFDGAFGPEGCGIALWAMSIIMLPCGSQFSIEYHFCACLLTPFPAARAFPSRGNKGERRSLLCAA